MDKPKQVNLIPRLIISICILILMFIFFGLFTFYHLYSISNLTRTIFNHPLVVSNAALQANVSITRIHRNMKDIVLFKSASMIQKSINAVNVQERQVYNYLDVIKQNILGEEGKLLEIESRQLFSEWRPIREEVIRLVNEGESEKAAGITIGKGAAHEALLEEKMLLLTRYARNKASLFMLETEKAYSISNIGTIIFLFSGILISSLIVLLILKQIVLAEKNLRESKQLLSNAIDFAPIGMVMVEPGGKFSKVNHAFCRLLGYSENELLQMNFQDITHPDDLGIGPRIIKKLMNNESSRESLEKRYIRKDNKTIHTYLTTTLLKNEKGEPLYFFAQVLDITKRKIADEELKKSKNMIDKIVNTAPNLIYITDLTTGCNLYTNDGITKLLGYSSNEILEMGDQVLTKLIHPDDMDKMLAHQDILRNSAENEIVEIEYRFRHKCGEYIFLRSWDTAFKKGKKGITTQIIGVAADITRQIEDQVSLKLEKDRAKFYLDVAEIMLIALDIKGNVSLINPKGCEILGYSQEEIIGKNWFENFIFKENRDEIIKVFNQILSGDIGPVKYFENPIKVKGGKSKLIAWHNSLLKDDKGNIVCLFSSGEDISERRKNEQEKEQLRNQLIQAQKMESIGRLAGGVAHDYNNALSVIMGFTELVLNEVDPSGPHHSQLDEVLKAATRARDITRQLLAFARKQTIAPKVLDLNESVESILKMLRRLIGEDIDLAWLPGTNLWPVEMDPAQIDQILANLCVNSRDAIAGVGKITIETNNITFNEDYCQFHPGYIPGDYILLAVSDDGCGMEKEIKDHIFEPFFTTKDKEKGTGLGLATVYGIIKQNKGFVNIYSEPKQGTAVKIYFPRYSGNRIKVNTLPIDSIPSGNSETIFLVEDDMPILKLEEKILKNLGYSVLTASTPEEAIGMAKDYNGDISLLITDVIMPKMNGRVLAKKLKEYYPKLKHIYTSGYTANVIAHHGVLDKDVKFIQKPFSKSDLAKIIREVLDN